MANIGGALKTLGDGLFKVAGARMQREDNELEAMRREALAKLQMSHAERLQAEDIQARKDLFDKEAEARATAAKDEREWRESESKKDRAAAAAAQTRQLNAARDAELRRAREDVTQNATRMIVSIDGQLRALQTEYAKAVAGSGGPLPPESERIFAAQMSQLQEERQRIQQQRVFDLQRIDAGGYGKGLSEDEVRKLVPAGAKGPREDGALFDPVEAGTAAAQESTGQAPTSPQSQMPMRADGTPEPPFWNDVPGMQPIGVQAPAQTRPSVVMPTPRGPSPLMNGMGGGASPIQQHAQAGMDTAARALQMLRAGQPLDPALAQQARRVGMSGLRQAGWSQQELAQVGY